MKPLVFVVNSMLYAVLPLCTAFFTLFALAILNLVKAMRKFFC